MCGIVGIISNSNVARRIIDSLYWLEYRGYDSSGIATVNDNAIEVRRVVGKINNLEKEVRSNPIDGSIGIGHTRWATHGEPAVRNAHPIRTNEVCVVHNGIIENHNELRKRLIKEGFQFSSETDTEVVPCLLTSFIRQGCTELDATIEASKLLEGAFALAILFTSNKDIMIGMKKGSPMVIGVGDNEMYLGSDALALRHLTDRIVYLEDGDIVVLDNKNYKVIDAHGNRQARTMQVISIDKEAATKNGHQHFMYKEILEQPQVLSKTLGHYYNAKQNSFNFKQLSMPRVAQEAAKDHERYMDLQKLERIYIIACGTSYYAACIAKYWFERYAKIPVEIDVASEFRYRSTIIAKNSAAIFISQSGETIDTLWALKHVKEQSNSYTIALVNVVESSIAQVADAVLPLYAGYEIGVASTKAFTAQLMVMGLLCLHLCRERQMLTSAEIQKHIEEINKLPDQIQETLKLDKDIHHLAKAIMHANNMVYMGRDVSYPLAMEGALKMKELTYIHAEGVAAGELKHGTIALVDDMLPIIAIAPNNAIFAKIASNIQEVASRKGKIIIFTDAEGMQHLNHPEWEIIKMPSTSDLTSPVVYAAALQLLAYHTANALGKDVDQPRNLAKSVTVE